MRESVTTADMGDTFATPRDTDSLAVLINKIGLMDRREGAHARTLELRKPNGFLVRIRIVVEHVTRLADDLSIGLSL